ncbi:MAG: Cyclin- protein fam58a [Thelocarpon impressellum]|nr:MAG: Cyclin- protein fam58a [Thelocarpon impressellum]
MPPASPRSVLRAAESQWIFTEEELLRTPSALDGLPLEQERENRAKGVNFITQVGIMLKLPQLTLATASVFMHRFFMRYSMVEKAGRQAFHYYAIAATSVFLATKVEENCRKMRELVIACCRVAQKNPRLDIDEQSKEYWRWRDTILHNEDLLLEAVCFDLSLEVPYKTLFDFLCHFDQQDNKRLRNAGWAFLNDSNLTMLCLLFPSRTIAAAALYCGAKHCEMTFPDDADGRAWWEVLGVELADIRKASNHMAAVYANNPLKQRTENTYARTPEEGDPQAAKTRQRTTLGEPRVPNLEHGTDVVSNGKRAREDEAEDGDDDYPRSPNGLVSPGEDDTEEQERGRKRPRMSPEPATANGLAVVENGGSPAPVRNGTSKKEEDGGSEEGELEE